MLRFKHYTQLQEAINQAQRDRLGIPNDEPTPIARKLTKGIIPEGEDHVRIPLTNNTKEKVRAHLEKHGYELSDYSKGEAKDKHGRTVSVSGILKNKKTEASAELTKGFENDDRKSKITPETHDIHLTAHRGDVATSGTNKNWPESCRNVSPKGLPTKYGKGAAARCIPEEDKGGTIAAFLLKKGDHNPDNAEARIMLHRYDHKDANGNIVHSVLMPERKVYSVGGGNQSDFQTSLDDYMRKKTPMIPGKVYEKNAGAYDDDGNKFLANTSPESIKEIMLGKGATNETKEDLVKHAKLPPKTISSVLNEPQTDSNYEDLRHAHKLIARHQKLSDEHFNHLLDNGHVEHLSSNDKLTKGQVKKIANYKQTPSTSGDSELDHIVNKSLGDSLATAHSIIVAKHHDKLGSDDIHSILDTNANREEELKKEGKKVDHAGPISAMANTNVDNLKLKPEHIEKIKKSINPASKDLTGESDDDFDSRTRLGITPEDSKKDIHDKLSKILDQPDSILTRTQKLAALNHKDISQEHISKGLDSTNPSVAHAAIRNKNASPENISKALKHPEVSVNLEAAKHKNNNEDTINEGLNHKNEMVARDSMENDNATSGNILNGLKHPELKVNIAAAEHKNNDENTINSALNPKNHRLVKFAAMTHENVTPKNISKGLDDPDTARAAIANKDATPEHISKALKSTDIDVRRTALTHDNATPEHYKTAMQDSEASIRVRAGHLLNQNKPNSYLNQ